MKENNSLFKTPADILVEKGYEDVIIFDNPSYDTCLIGLTSNNQAVYDYDLMVEWLVEHENMDLEDAVDFIDYNSSFCCGKHYPVIYYNYEEEFEDLDDCEKIVFTRIEDLQVLN